MFVPTDAQKMSARKHCGVPVYGNDLTNLSSVRFFQWYGLFEYRIGRLSDVEGVEFVNFLITLDALETAIITAADNLIADAAASYVHNKNEIRDRERLYRTWRLRLCSFLGIPGGPELRSGGVSFVQ